jgi:HlyD family secretion protein
MSKPIATTLLSLLLLAGCAKEDVVEQARETTRVRVLTARAETLQPSIEFTGSVVSRTIAKIHPEVSGMLEEVSVRVGDEVQAGQTLARIDPEDFRLELEIAKSEKLKAQAEYDRIVRGFRPEEIDSQRGVSENAKALLQARESNLERNRNLYQAGTMTERDWTVFLAETAAARAMVEKSSAELTKMLRGYEDYDVRSASASLALAQAREDLARRKLDQTNIVSPVKGLVTLRQAEVGQLVGPSNQLYEVQDPDAIWLEASVSMMDAPAICVGQGVTLISEVQNNSAKGFVDRIGQAMEQRTRSMPVWFAWSPGSPLPPIGSFAKVAVDLEPAEGAILLRRDWVHLAGGEYYVWLVEKEALGRQAVRIGKDQGDRVAIAEGLSAGMKVVVSPPNPEFKEGLPVRTEEFTPPGREGSGSLETISLSSLDLN